MKSINRPIFIVGAPRSGTTFLGRLFRKHPSVAYLNEPSLVWRYGNDKRSDLLEPRHLDPAISRHIKGFFLNYMNTHEKPRFAEKTPQNSMRMGFINELFPDCLFIHIVRNGYESALSIEDNWVNQPRGLRDLDRIRLMKRLQEASIAQFPYYAGRLLRMMLNFAGKGEAAGRNIWGPRLPGIDGMVRDLSIIEIASIQWRTCVELACGFGRSLPEDRYWECKLEDLNSERVESMFEFCGLDRSHLSMDYMSGAFDSRRVSYRVESCPNLKLTQMNRWISNTMSALGYPVFLSNEKALCV